MRRESILQAVLVSFAVFASTATAQTVTSVEPAVVGQAKARPLVRINLNGSFGDGRIIADGLAITIADDLYGRGSRTYEFDTAGNGISIGGAIEVDPPTAEIFDAFTELTNVINSDPTAPFWAVYFYDSAIGNNGWYLIVWKYDDEYRLTSGPPFGPTASEAADPNDDITIAGNFSTNNSDNAPVYLQLQGTDLNLLNNSTSVKLRHDVQTSEVYDALLTAKYAFGATAQIRLASGSGSPPVFPTLGEYDLMINGSEAIDKAVTLVENLVDDQSFRVHASGGAFTLDHNAKDILHSPYWRGTVPYKDTARVGSLFHQKIPRIYPFRTNNNLEANANSDNENISLQWLTTTDGTRELWQTTPVNFAVDTTLTLTGLWAASTDHYGMSYGVQLRSGGKDGTIIAETPPGQQVITPFDWTEFALSGRFPAGTTEVTVVFYGDYTDIGVGDKVLHVEEVLLRVDDDHPAPPSITGMTTPNYAAVDTTNATITLTGENLAAGQTSVTLRPPNITIESLSWADVGRDLVDDEEAFARYEWTAGDQIVLTSGSNVILGAYDIASKDSDNVISLVNDINDAGGDVGGISGYIVNAPLAAGTVNASGTQVTATFDLTGAATGYYNIIVEVGTNEPIVWREGFNVVNVGPNLVNGSFELPESFQDCDGTRVETFTPASDWKARFWDGYMAGTGPILQFRDDEWGESGFPSCPAPELGIHYHSTATQTSGGTAQYYQTVTASPASLYTLSGFFANRSEGGASNSVTLELLDGDSTSAPMTGASVEVLSEAVDGGTDWTFAYVEGTATGGTMTAAWEVQGKGSESSHTAYADGLVLEECTVPVTIASVDPPAAALDDLQPITLTITGTGFSGNTPEILLTRVGETIFASNIIVENDSTLTCEINNLPTNETTAYDLVIRNNGCIETLANGFVIASTEIVNAEFEDPPAALQCTPRVPNTDPVTAWNFTDELIREGDVFPPAECPHLSCDCPESMTGCAGGHYASMSTGEGEIEQAWQALKVTPGAGVNFGGWFSWDGQGTVNIKIVDGYGPDGTVLGTAPVLPQGDDWCYSSVEGFAIGELVTVVWELVDTVEFSPAAVHADGMTFSFSPCHDPFADTDSDGDVDHEDFALFQQCFTGNGGGILPEPTYCACLDVEGAGGLPDDDVDSADLPLFEACASGPGVPADVTCDD